MEFNKYSKRIVLSKNRLENTVKYKSSQLYIKSLVNTQHRNSSIFSLFDPSSYYEEMVIKICNFENNDERNANLVRRFEREIQALSLANQNGCKNIIKILDFNEIQICNKPHKYYVMEKADKTLENLIESGELEISQRTSICKQLLNGVGELHKLNIYHRDLKPQNVLFKNDELKICDLGLIDYAQEDQIFEKIDVAAERIGPFGWFSPEAMNKYFTEGENRHLEYDYDCKIDNKSDIFQLGKLFWYIFQANVPVGQLMEEDFLYGDKKIFSILNTMLQYRKEKRPDIEILEKQFAPIFKYLVA